MTLPGQAQIIGGIIPNMIAFLIFCLFIFYYAKTGKIAEMLVWNKKYLEKKLQIFNEH